ncbi:MAG: helix-turn-helix transcriptional regulator [Acidobacteria bacterium]|nr:helix-turn-helix transcriptional regulator [Acidobacteriota bacterium]
MVTTIDRKALTREVLLGFWKVHILHHAAEQPVVGQWILAELRRHGYDVSPGTLYPLLKRMERNGWLRCEVEPGRALRRRRYYHLTPGGAAVLRFLRETVVELHREVVQEAAIYERRQFDEAPSGPAPARRAPKRAERRPAAPARRARR